MEPGALVMLHASLRKLGLARSNGVEDGADLLLDAVEAAIGPGGTMMMVLGSDYAFDWVNEHPADQRAALLAGTEPLDPSEAGVLPEVGWVAETFRRRPGTLFSDNPSGRFGARGPLAETLLGGQPWNDYYGPGSPLEKLCARNGRILRLGANPDTVTALHYAEYLARLPDKRRTRWDYLLKTAEGPRHCWIDCLDDSQGIAPWNGEDYFALILKAYLSEGRGSSARVGNASAELIEAADLVAFGAGWMEANLPAGSPADIQADP